jgi:hypothetical protein
MPGSGSIELPSSPPHCALCNGETDFQNIHEDPTYILLTYKCRSCAVEHHVKKPRPDPIVVLRP